MTTFNPLWDVIQEYMDDPKHRYPPKPADLARETGVSEQVLSKWKKRPTLPEPEQLMKVAKGTGIRYSVLLLNALYGREYLPPQQHAVLEEDFDNILPEGDWIDAWMRNYLELDEHERQRLGRIAELNAIIADLLDGGEGLTPVVETSSGRIAARDRVAPLLARRRLSVVDDSVEDAVAAFEKEVPTVGEQGEPEDA